MNTVCRCESSVIQRLKPPLISAAISHQQTRQLTRRQRAPAHPTLPRPSCLRSTSSRWFATDRKQLPPRSVRSRSRKATGFISRSTTRTGTGGRMRRSAIRGLILPLFRLSALPAANPPCEMRPADAYLRAPASPRDLRRQSPSAAQASRRAARAPASAAQTIRAAPCSIAPPAPSA